MATETSERQHGFAQIDAALHDISAAGTRLREEQQAAWRRYLDEVDRALTEDLQPEDVTEDVVDELVSHAHNLFDELRVQARLGVMEGGDALAEVRQAFARVAERLHLPVR